MDRKIGVLVTLANHELPPKETTPGIGRLIHNQLQCMDYNQFEIQSVCVESNKGEIIDIPLYRSKVLSFNNFHYALVQSLGKRVRKFVFGISDAKKIHRSLLIFYYSLKHLKLFDVIIIHNYPLTAIWLNRFKKIFKPQLKVIYYYHSSNFDWFRTVYPRIIESSGIVTIAGDEINDVISCNIINNHSRIRVYPPSKAANSLRIISTSNIDENKGLLHVVDAVKALNKNGKSVILDLYGKAKEQVYFEKLLKSIEEYPFIIYKGYVPNNNLMQIVSTYDLMVLLSQKVEGNSMSLIEAIVEARIPVIASAVGGNPLVLNQGKFGKLISNYHDGNELYDTLLSFIEDTKLLDRYRLFIEQEADSYFSSAKSGALLSSFILKVFNSNKN